MNFVEGTRFTQEKHDRQNSPFSHLLKPKAGGVAFVLSAMGSQLHKLIDVTIDYPSGVPSFWDFVSGKVRDIRVSIKVTPITDITENGYFNDNYFDDPKVRSQFQRWLNSRWQDKNDQLESINATQKPL